ncbi:lysophospholipid acyltransferase family protein [Shewanella gelidii]|uniref:1-acyl-sn-glycerol-3-phosphate acyltransferase n=1 Tax=Shewanella gelidii TaxID=1642821 RepID=A0A917NAX4_9GAMM|nr:lysophospholipid acyltransferase family protein [Shewanella gelidii]MCL1098317.1 1-acyl-sn-glycerol-3-phosphate acyltransferase [Shewanella gelidii]GGI84333.1 1-acyl-sn-glycerol-3-phosphate acyltransferase [Shewanella gelidii]
MNRFFKVLFVALIAKPLVLILLGLNVIHREKLPQTGPSIIAVNHNSHLDTLVLLSLYPLSLVHRLRPVAAADYFLSNRIIAWFSLNVIGIIPLTRNGSAKRDLFSDCHKALDNGDILLIYPEGTRGEPEVTSKLKKGIYYLVKDRDDVSIVPVVTHGLGRALPKGEALLVPFNCDVVIGNSLDNKSSPAELVESLTDSYKELLLQCLTYHEHD